MAVMRFCTSGKVCNHSIACADNILAELEHIQESLITPELLLYVFCMF